MFFRYIGYFAKNVNFLKKFFVLCLISWYILEIPRRSFLPLSEWQGLRCFLILLSLVVHTGDSSSVVPPSVGMTGFGWIFSRLSFLSSSLLEWYFLTVILRSEAMWGSTVYNSGSTWLRNTYSRFLVEPFWVLCRNDRVGWIVLVWVLFSTHNL